MDSGDACRPARADEHPERCGDEKLVAGGPRHRPHQRAQHQPAERHEGEQAADRGREGQQHRRRE